MKALGTVRGMWANVGHRDHHHHRYHYFLGLFSGTELVQVDSEEAEKVARTLPALLIAEQLTRLFPISWGVIK